MSYPTDVIFDIETLINVAQPDSILLVGDVQPAFLDDYRTQKSLLSHNIELVHIPARKIDLLGQQNRRFDVGIAIDLFEHISKQQGASVLSKLRDVLTAQYCACLPISNIADPDSWHLNELFSFALNRVNTYQQDETEYGLFKYNISDYKKTPDWLNANNWANPQMWGKYWW